MSRSNLCPFVALALALSTVKYSHQLMFFVLTIEPYAACKVYIPVILTLSKLISFRRSLGHSLLKTESIRNLALLANTP